MKHSVYFDGNVQSLSLETKEGPATIGVMKPGKYTFSTSSQEHMKVIEGTLKAKLPGETGFKPYAKGQAFIVAPKTSFDVEAVGDVAYICFYK